MKLHLRKSRRMTRDGTWTIESISHAEYESLLAWARESGALQSPRQPIENGDVLLITERGRYYKGSFLDTCPNA